MAHDAVSTLLKAAGGPRGPLPGPAMTTAQPIARFSTASIIALVTGRERCRDIRDWEGADSIRQDLRANGVDVWDKEKVWRANDGRQGVITRP